MFWGVWIVSGKERRLFIVAGLNIIVLIPSINVLLGVFVVFCLISWDCRFQ
jgi:hypothetical protein